MKKIISIITMLTLLTILIFTGNSYAAALDTINIETDETTVRPGEEVVVTVDFGQQLGAYTINVAYDNNIFEYVSVEGGTANDTTDKVKVTYHDTTGGTNARENMTVTFRAKADITTSNPTEFTITAEGLSNADASVTFDDITTPIVKNVTVEPQYVDYTIDLTHTGDIIKEKEIDMKLSYSSPMGKYYEHARLIAEATTPKSATVQLIGTDDAQLEHDIIQSGWGDAQGFKIGGKDVSQELDLKGTFSDVGEYKITLKLIDRDNSDSVIAEKAFDFTVIEEQTPTPPVTDPDQKPDENPDQNPEETPTTPEPEKPEEPIKPENTEEMPSTLPKTGNNIYVPIVIILIALIGSYVYYNKSKNK